MVSDRDVKFVSYFCQTLWHKMGTKLKFLTAFHTQTDGQTEIVNRTLGNLLRCLVVKKLKTWYLIMPMTKFAYNSSVNRTTGLSSFEIVIGFKFRQPVDLIFMTHHHFRISDSVSAFTSHIHALYEEIREKMKINADYKASANLHHRLRTFNVGDYVMVRMRPERFSSGTVKKLHAQSAGPF